MSNKVNPEAATLQEDEKEEQNALQEQNQVKKPLLNKSQYKLLVGIGGAAIIGLELYTILYIISIFLSS